MPFERNWVWQALGAFIRDEVVAQRPIAQMASRQIARRFIAQTAEGRRYASEWPLQANQQIEDAADRPLVDKAEQSLQSAIRSLLYGYKCEHGLRRPRHIAWRHRLTVAPTLLNGKLQPVIVVFVASTQVPLDGAIELVQQLLQARARASLKRKLSRKNAQPRATKRARGLARYLGPGPWRLGPAFGATNPTRYTHWVHQRTNTRLLASLVNSLVAYLDAQELLPRNLAASWHATAPGLCYNIGSIKSWRDLTVTYL